MPCDHPTFGSDPCWLPFGAEAGAESADFELIIPGARLPGAHGESIDGLQRSAGSD